MKVEWFKVSEKLPSIQDVVIMYYRGRIRGNAAVGFYNGEEWYLFHTDARNEPVASPTYWCYLPDAPDVE